MSVPYNPDQKTLQLRMQDKAAEGVNNLSPQALNDLYQLVRPGAKPDERKGHRRSYAYQLFSGHLQSSASKAGHKQAADGKKAFQGARASWEALGQPGQAHWHIVQAVVNKREDRK